MEGGERFANRRRLGNRERDGLACTWGKRRDSLHDVGQQFFDALAVIALIATPGYSASWAASHTCWWRSRHWAIPQPYRRFPTSKAPWHQRLETIRSAAAICANARATPSDSIES